MDAAAPPPASLRALHRLVEVSKTAVKNTEEWSSAHRTIFVGAVLLAAVWLSVAALLQALAEFSVAGTVILWTVAALFTVIPFLVVRPWLQELTDLRACREALLEAEGCLAAERAHLLGGVRGTPATDKDGSPQSPDAPPCYEPREAGLVQLGL
jgi:hypothetical protein